MNFTDYLFEHSSKLNKTAVIYERPFSYEEIFRAVLRLGTVLQGKSTNKNIILISENSVFFIISYLAIIKSGNTCVPVNPSTGITDLRYIIETCNAGQVFCQKKYIPLLDVIRDLEFEQITETEIEMSIGVVGEGNKLQTTPEEDTAVILFTSGSTAKPKGVMLSHNNLIHNTESIIEYLKLSEKDRIEVVLPFYYCYGTSLLHTHLRVGGSLVINNKFMFPTTVIDDLIQYECTGFAGVPSNFQILLRKTDIKKHQFPALRYITQAGGKLPQVFIEELIEVFHDQEIYIMYGQTEATARMSYLPPSLLHSKMGSIGKGIPGTALLVLNKEGNPVKPGEVGEVAAKGLNIMQGYFNDPVETAKVIRNGLLYTGDLATIDAEGYIYLVSREKQMIKSGGNRISPKEIEEVIARIPEVVEVAVVGVEDELLGEAVKAYIVLQESAEHLDKSLIIQHCRLHLPTYKVPRYIEFLKSIPKNSSGKVLLTELK